MTTATVIPPPGTSSDDFSMEQLPVSSSESIAEVDALFPESSSWSSSILARSHPAVPRSRQGSPRSVVSSLSFSSAVSPSAFRSHRISSSRCFYYSWGLASTIGSLLRTIGSLERETGLMRRQRVRRRKDGGWWGRQRRRTLALLWWAAVVGFFFIVNWLISSTMHHDLSSRQKNLTFLFKANVSTHEKVVKPRQAMYKRLLSLTARALADEEGKPEPQDLWKESLDPTMLWTPCADKRSWKPSEGTNGYILVSANGGISQQRGAICNAVTVARLLNATLVLPRFLYSNVWQDASQFGDIYEEEHFINYLKGDIRIVKELPVELQSLDLKGIGSLVTDDEVMKEAKPSFYVKKILPILLRNRVVHFTGFGNRLAFDPIPFDLQRLRCRCNFHALIFVNKIQETGALLVKRMRLNQSQWSLLEHNLLGPFAAKLNMNGKSTVPVKASRYLALHLRFEIDMAAYSMCYFGGGREEEEELEAYREVHFPALTAQWKTIKRPSPEVLRSEGQCPLTPEEAVLMLAALGFKRKTRIYVAGADIYGGKSRMTALKSLYSNLANKESLLSPSEIEPFRNYSSQLAALDFIACTAADAFAMTDSGSQLSSLVAGYRVYYSSGTRPTIRPNKRRLASILSKNSTIGWKQFERRIRKAVRQTKMVQERSMARSIYSHPRCLECMCPADS